MRRLVEIATQHHAMVVAALCAIIANPLSAQTERRALEQVEGLMAANSEVSTKLQAQGPSGDNLMQKHPYIGMWLTGDGRIRQQLKADGRYAEARGDRENAYTGRYEVDGNTIQYWDDSGFTTDGEFVDDVLYHGGMVMYRQEVDQ